MYISELVDCCNLLEWVNAFSNKFAVFGSLYFANNNCTLWPWISPSLVSGPLLVSLRTNFGYKSHNYEPCKQLKKVRMLQKEGSFSPKPPDNIQRGGSNANKQRTCCRQNNNWRKSSWLCVMASLPSWTSQTSSGKDPPGPEEGESQDEKIQ